MKGDNIKNTDKGITTLTNKGNIKVKQTVHLQLLFFSY